MISAAPTLAPTTAAARIDRSLLLAGLAQVAATFTPAGHVRLLDSILFIKLPNAGAAFVVLGLLTALCSLRARGWWRAIPALCTAILIAIVYARMQWSPSGGWADPLLRRIVRPAWGFVPMSIATLGAILTAVRRARA